MSFSAVVGMSCSWYGVRRLTKSNSNFSSSSIFRALSKLVGDAEKLNALIEPLADPKKAWSVLLMLRATPLPFGMINALFAITKLQKSSKVGVRCVSEEISDLFKGTRVANDR